MLMDPALETVLSSGLTQYIHPVWPVYRFLRGQYCELKRAAFPTLPHDIIRTSALVCSFEVSITMKLVNACMAVIVLSRSTVAPRTVHLYVSE